MNNHYFSIGEGVLKKGGTGGGACPRLLSSFS